MCGCVYVLGGSTSVCDIEAIKHQCRKQVSRRERGKAGQTLAVLITTKWYRMILEMVHGDEGREDEGEEEADD